MFKLYIIPFFVVALFSCNSKNSMRVGENPSPAYTDKFTLVETEVKKFPLDSVTAAGESVQYFEDEDKAYFCYLNSKDNSILFYDYKNSNLDFKLPLHKDGPDGVGKISGFLVHNLDSIFVYKYGAAHLYLINKNGKVKNRYGLKSSNPLSFFPPSVSGSMPMIKVKNSIFFNAWGARKYYAKHKDYPENLVIELDLLKDSLSYHFKYPDIYTTGIWGMQLHVMYNTYNPKNSNFIYSFPIDHNIYVTDHKGFIKEYYVGSKFVNKVEPLSNKTSISPPPPPEEWKLERTQATYRGIKYDIYNDYYFRIVYKGMSEEDFESRHPIKARFHKASILILDNKFNKVGEVELEDYKYFEHNMFFTEKGMHLMQRDYENEDTLSFSIMKLQKNENI